MAKKWKCVKKHGPTQLCYGCVVKYQNPDKRCGHPKARDTKKKTWSAVGYCWGYATLVDGGKEKTAPEKLCSGCELWDGGKSRPAQPGEEGGG